MNRTPYVQDPDLTLFNGDVREVLAGLPDESVQMCVTSPPYFQQRDYGVAGQIGLEATPTEYVASLVNVFRELRRVLRKDGMLWLNLGDSYASGGGFAPDAPSNLARAAGDGRGSFHGERRETSLARVTGGRKAPPGLKPKDLLLMPARVALALQADGWYLRSEITWCKPNPMPESVTDRPTQATEKLYLLTRSTRYVYDAEAVREPYRYDGRRVTHVEGRDGSLQHRSGERWPGIGKAHHAARADLISHGHDESEPMEITHAGRNLRNWWEIAAEPFVEAHFATYPTELVRRCIAAGSAEGDVVLDPFFGSGTTGLVARRLGRKCVGIELSPEYCALAAKRLSQLSLLAEPAA